MCLLQLLIQLHGYRADETVDSYVLCAGPLAFSPVHPSIATCQRQTRHRSLDSRPRSTAANSAPSSPRARNITEAGLRLHSQPFRTSFPDRTARAEPALPPDRNRRKRPGDRGEPAPWRQRVIDEFGDLRGEVANRLCRRPRRDPHQRRGDLVGALETAYALARQDDRAGCRPGGASGSPSLNRACVGESSHNRWYEQPPHLRIRRWTDRDLARLISRIELDRRPERDGSPTRRCSSGRSRGISHSHGGRPLTGISARAGSPRTSRAKLVT